MHCKAELTVGMPALAVYCCATHACIHACHWQADLMPTLCTYTVWASSLPANGNHVEVAHCGRARGTRVAWSLVNAMMISCDLRMTQRWTRHVPPSCRPAAIHMQAS
jgi:hypothetical protein